MFIFTLLMVTLVELGAAFWVGAQLWLNFVLLPSTERYKAEETNINAQVEQRFERRFSLPILLVLLLAGIGVLISQALELFSGNWNKALSPALLAQAATRGRFGAFWLMSEIVIVMAIAVAISMLRVRQRPRMAATLLPLINLLLGTALFIAMAMYSSATDVSSNLAPYAIVVDWLHLLASALWVGGLFYITTSYLPVLKQQSAAITARSMTHLLPYFSILVIVGIIIAAVTGLFSAIFHLTSSNQLFDTAYGRTLLVKIGLTAALLVTGAIHMGILQPRVKKEYKKYSYAVARLAPLEASAASAKSGAPVAAPAQQEPQTTVPGSASQQLAKQVRMREQRLGRKTRPLASLLRWESLLGVAIIICVGLMSAFSTIPAASTNQPSKASSPVVHTTTHTRDGKYNVTLEINPNHFGTNVFTVSVVDNATGKPVTSGISVIIAATMLDMDMGTNEITLLPDGHGHFSASGDLSMPGNWQVGIQIRTPDHALHEAIVNFYTPF
jgi:copper transport protein